MNPAARNRERFIMSNFTIQLALEKSEAGPSAAKETRVAAVVMPTTRPELMLIEPMLDSNGATRSH